MSKSQVHSSVPLDQKALETYAALEQVSYLYDEYLRLTAPSSMLPTEEDREISTSYSPFGVVVWPS